MIDMISNIQVCMAGRQLIKHMTFFSLLENSVLKFDLWPKYLYILNIKIGLKKIARKISLQYPSRELCQLYHYVPAYV